MLGELSRQDGQEQAAIEHFSRAAKLDPAFADAFLGLGRTLLAGGKTAEAISPLETAVKLDPANAMSHLQLANAYTQAGRKEDAAREFALQKQAAEKVEQNRQQLRQNAPPQ